MGLALTMPTPKAYEPSSQNFEGPHSAGDNYIKSFSADELKVRDNEQMNTFGDFRPHPSTPERLPLPLHSCLIPRTPPPLFTKLCL